MRSILKKITGEYDLWHIYSIATANCQVSGVPLLLEPIDDVSIFARNDLDEDLKKADWSEAGAFGFVVWRDGEPAGVCWYWSGASVRRRNVGPLHRDEAELIQITIARRFRGLGIGHSLITRTSVLMRDAGFQRLYAQVWHSNRPSHRAFSAAGWKRVARLYRISPPWLRTSFEFRQKICRGVRAAEILSGWPDGRWRRVSK